MGSMFDDQPSLIQDYDPGSPGNESPWGQPKARTPLVLIHDGGGTIFSYYCLGDLGRPVHGIGNPHYDSGAAWAGGIPEMARHYCAFIRAALPAGGDVIVGGWSLGGLLALEVSRQLAAGDAAEGNAEGDAEVGLLKVVGIVMIDSVCPVVLTAPGLPIVQHNVQWSEHTRQETKDRVMRCFSEAVRMVGEWKLPVWEESHEAGEKPAVRRLVRPPPVVLLRAMERVPVPASEEGVSRVDIHRLDRQLGWGNYRKDLITKVIDIPGHHFNIFHTEDTLDSTTEGIKRACWEIEMMDSGRSFA